MVKDEFLKSGLDITLAQVSKREQWFLQASPTQRERGRPLTGFEVW